MMRLIVMKDLWLDTLNFTITNGKLLIFLDVLANIMYFQLLNKLQCKREWNFDIQSLTNNPSKLMVCDLPFLLLHKVIDSCNVVFKFHCYVMSRDTWCKNPCKNCVLRKGSAIFDFCGGRNVLRIVLCISIKCWTYWQIQAYIFLAQFSLTKVMFWHLLSCEKYSISRANIEQNT